MSYKPFEGSKVDSNNTTTSTLGIDAVFTGTGTEILSYNNISVQLFADQDSAVSGISIEFSVDNSNWDEKHTFTLTASETRNFQFPCHSKYFRLVYTNGGTEQGAFRVQTMLHQSGILTTIHRLGDDVDPDRSSQLIKSILIAQKAGSGDFTPIDATNGGNLKVSLEEFDDSFNTSSLPVSEKAKTAFGELSIAELTPIVQIHSAYNINTRILEERNNGGATSVVNNKFQVSTGAATNRTSSLLSKIAVKYNAGQGGLFRGTAVFDTPAANSTQYIGIGTSSEGYFFGYNGTAFGILRRQGGSPEIRTLTVSTGSSDADSITITLDGDAEAVSVTDVSGDTTLTANEIAAHDYSGLGQGWKAHATGANVTFESFNAALQTGTYSLTDATSAVGAFAQNVAGVAPTNTIVAQSSWSEDKAAGAEILPSLDFTKGNVFQIRYQWLGFGAIEFYIEQPSTGEFILVHRIEYANANTVPSLDNPTLPICLAVSNTSNTSDIVLQSSSLMGAIEGKDLEEGIINNISAEDTGTGTNETPIFSIHNHTVYQSKINRVRIELTTFSASIDSTTANKPSTIRIRINPTLTGAVFSAVDASTSVVMTDTSATAVSGGNIIYSQIITEGASPPIDFTKIIEKLNPGDTVTVSLESSSGNVDSVISMNWKELF